MIKKMMPLLLVVVLLLSACGGAKTLDVPAFGAKVLAEGTFEDEINPTPDRLILQLYGIADEDIKQKSFYTGTGYTPEEIAIVEAVDAKAADKIEAAFKTRVEDQRRAFENYIPEEMPKLNDPPIRRSGNYVVMVISADDAEATTLIEAFLKG